MKKQLAAWLRMVAARLDAPAPQPLVINAYGLNTSSANQVTAAIEWTLKGHER